MSNLQKIDVLDLDNCISDDEHRRHFIKEIGPNKYEEYHSHCGFDRFVWDCDHKFPDHYVIITSRPEKYAALTLSWCEKNLPKGIVDVYMRTCNDYRSSVDVKRDAINLLKFMVRGEYVINRVFDDRDDVVQMYKELGFNTILKQINKR